MDYETRPDRFGEWVIGSAQLTGDQGGSALMAVLDDVEEATALAVIEFLRPRAVDDQDIDPGQESLYLFMAAVAAGELKGGEQSRRMSASLNHNEINRFQFSVLSRLGRQSRTKCDKTENFERIDGMHIRSS